jgi:hypothetical protein
MIAIVITPEQSASIQRLIEASVQTGDADSQEAASRTGGLPVYADLGGVLVLGFDGVVFHFDPESDKVVKVDDDRWVAFALAKASKKFAELSNLQLERPAGAVTCSQCGGRGVVLSDVDCGKCFGVGWLMPSDPVTG